MGNLAPARVAALIHFTMLIDNDDEPCGRVLSRREALALFGVAGVALLTGCSRSGESATDTTPTLPDGSSTCVVRPELTEGPYYFDEELNRSDIRSDTSTGAVKDGAALALTFNVSSVAGSSCAPLATAVVDVWHCDALGVYSDVRDAGFDTSGHNFLRGLQVTDANGVATLTTIYPGWYRGRAVHIHFKVRSAAGASHTYEFTSQLFFDDSLTDQVHAQAPYASKGQRDVRNSQDGIYQQGGSQLLLDVAQASGGYAATFNIALQNA